MSFLLVIWYWVVFEMNTPVFLWVLVTALHFFGITCSLEQRYMQGAIKTVFNHRLNGHQIRTQKGSTSLSCAHSCLMETRCVSTNFGISSAENKLLCELNDHVDSLISGDELMYAEGFTYSAYSPVFRSSINVMVGDKVLLLHVYCNILRFQFLLVN